MRRVVAIAVLALVAYSARAEFIGWVGIPLIGEDSVPMVEVPDVIGEADSTAADMILEGVGLDLGAATARCSDAPADEVVGQDPGPGVEVELGSLVNVLVSNGVECQDTGRNGVRVRGLRMPGI